MKHLLKTTLLLLAILLPGTAFAHDFEVDGIYYKINGNNVTVTYRGSSYYDYSNEYSGIVTIPASIDYNGTSYNVTAIGESAFSGCSGLTSISIPESVNSIGNFAFYNCSGLTSISIPSSVTSINLCAFEGCSGLTSITIPSSVTTIGESAFGFCSGLTSITISEGVTSIGELAFRFCSGLTSITIPESVTSIVDGAFANCSGLTSIMIPSSVTSIGNIFVGCSGLETIIVNANNSVYDSRNNCNAIIQKSNNVLIVGCKTTIIPSSVTRIGASAFGGCSGLTSISIPSNVSSISDCAFSNCSVLDKVFSYKADPSNFAMGEDVFYRYPQNYDSRTLYVPAGSLAAYQADTEWSQYFGSIVEMGLVNSIELNYTAVELAMNESLQLTATLTPEDATNKTVNWSSNNPTVASVDNNGLVTALSVGTATITATTTDGSNLSASCQVTVKKQYVTSITLNESSLVMHIGDTFQLIADVQPENASYPTLSWSTGNSAVARVDNNGLVTAIEGGTTYIRASATDGSNVYVNCSIEVIPDYYIKLDTLSHIRGESSRIVDLPVTLVNKNPISGIQFDVALPTGVKFNLVNGEPDVWLDDARGTRSHSISASLLSNGKYRVLVTSSTSKNLRGNDGELVHMNMLLPQIHDTGNRYISISNIIASEADETRHTLDNKSTIVRFYYMVGDADANAVVDIADHAATASKILGKSPSPFYYDAANVDDNNSLDVVDLVGITNIALQIKPITVRQVPRRGSVENRLFCDRLRLNAGGEREIVVGVDCDFDFAGFQMDVKLPQGLTLVDASLGDEAHKLGLVTETVTNGKIRILGTSFSDAVVNGVCSKLLTLKVKAENDYLPGSEVEFLDIIFAERNLTAHVFDGTCVEYLEQSSIYELMGETRIYVENGNIIVDTPIAGDVQLIAVDGRMVEYPAHIGHNVYEVGVEGIYIIHFNGKTLKVRL